MSYLIYSSLNEINVNSYKDSLILAYADNIKKFPHLSFPSLKPGLLKKFISKFKDMERGFQNGKKLMF